PPPWRGCTASWRRRASFTRRRAVEPLWQVAYRVSLRLSRNADWPRPSVSWWWRPDAWAWITINFSSGLKRRSTAYAEERISTMENAIEAVKVTRYYGEKRGVQGLNLSVPTGSILGLLGENGYGKSTTLKLAMGMIFPNEG